MRSFVIMPHDGEINEDPQVEGYATLEQAVMACVGTYGEHIAILPRLKRGGPADDPKTIDDIVEYTIYSTTTDEPLAEDAIWATIEVIELAGEQRQVA